MPAKRKNLGFGLCLRQELVKPILEQRPALDWLEIISDNYLDINSDQFAQLEQIREYYPLTMHGASLSLGGPDPLDQQYIQQLKLLADHINPASISDHLCWTLPGQSHSYDLRPLPRTEEMINYLTPRITAVQEGLGRQILLENVADTLPHTNESMPEWEFVSQVVESADCLILLDLNNLISNGVAQSFDPSDYVRRLPAGRIWQIHLAPLMNRLEYEWDADTGKLNDPVWQLYQEVIDYCGPVTTMLERNDDIPPLEELLEELEQARLITQSVT